jgi:Recombinase
MAATRAAQRLAALQAAKALWQAHPKLSDARRHAAVANVERADRYSANVLPVIREIQDSRIGSFRGIARSLAARGIPTARGGRWTPVQVSDILRRVWTGDTAFGIEPNGARRKRSSSHLAGEQFPGQGGGSVGLSQWRQRLGIEGALVLRVRRAVHKK